MNCVKFDILDSTLFTQINVNMWPFQRIMRRWFAITFKGSKHRSLNTFSRDAIHKKDAYSSYFLPKVPPNGQFVIYALNTCCRGLIEFRRTRRYVKLETNITDSLKEETSTVSNQSPINQFNNVLEKLCQGKQVQITADYWNPCHLVKDSNLNVRWHKKGGIDLFFETTR